MGGWIAERDAMRYGEEDVREAAFLFEETRGKGSVEADRLARELVASVMEDPEDDPGYRGSVYWALGKRCDPALVPFFRERLELELERDVEAVYQILIALEDAGEAVFSPARLSRSVMDHEMNRADALGYLGG